MIGEREALRPRDVRNGPGSEASSYDLSGLLNKWLRTHGPSEIFQTCENCRHMSEQGPAFCALYQMTPPASVIVGGCPSHDDKHEVPF